MEVFRRRKPMGILLKAEELIRLRKLKTWTQQELANKADVTIKAVCKAENGQSISLENADCIARELGKTLVDLVAVTMRAKKA